MEKKKQYIVYGLLCIVLSLALQAIKVNILPAKYFYDANHVLRIMQDNPKIRLRDSYQISAVWFKNLAECFPQLFSLQVGGMILWILAFVPAVYLFIKYSRRIGSSMIFILLYSALLPLFVICVQKEFWQLMWAFIVMLSCFLVKPNDIKGIIMTALLLLIWGLVFRRYYIIVALAYIGLWLVDFLISKTADVHAKRIVVHLAVIGCVLLVLILALVKPELICRVFYSRVSINLRREGSEDARTILQDVFVNKESLSDLFLLNYLLMAIRMMFPLELLHLDIKYIVYVGCQLLWTSIMIIAIVSLWHGRWKQYKEKNLLLLMMAWYLVEFLFEPDFGSFVRHQSAMFPIMYPVICCTNEILHLPRTRGNKKIYTVGRMPIRVAYILNRMDNGGIESVVMNYYRNIDHSKVKIDFFYYEESELPQREELEAMGARVYKLPSYSRVIDYHQYLYKILVKNDYQIVHSHLGTMSVFPLCAAWHAGTPIRICHNHSTAEMRAGKKSILKYLLRPTCRIFATEFWACGKKAATWMYGKDVVDAGYVQILPNAIEPSKFVFSEEDRASIRREFRIPQNAVAIGHVGRFTYPKNHWKLLEIERVLLKHKDVYLLLVGDGELFDEIKTLSTDMQGRVIFAGVRQDVNRLYSAMDVFCLPSFYEEMPVVAWEAQANGLCCVFSDNVSREAALYEEACFIGLKESNEQWAEVLLKASKCTKRIRESSNISRVPDIHEWATSLETFYLDLAKC